MGFQGEEKLEKVFAGCVVQFLPCLLFQDCVQVFNIVDQLCLVRIEEGNQGLQGTLTCEAGEDLEGQFLKPADRAEEVVDAEREEVGQLLLMVVRQTPSVTHCFIEADKGQFRWRQQSFLQEEGEVADWPTCRDL